MRSLFLQLDSHCAASLFACDKRLFRGTPTRRRGAKRDLHTGFQIFEREPTTVIPRTARRLLLDSLTLRLTTHCFNRRILDTCPAWSNHEPPDRSRCARRWRRRSCHGRRSCSRGRTFVRASDQRQRKKECRYDLHGRLTLPRRPPWRPGRPAPSCRQKRQSRRQSSRL